MSKAWPMGNNDRYTKEKVINGSQCADHLFCGSTRHNSPGSEPLYFCFLDEERGLERKCLPKTGGLASTESQSRPRTHIHEEKESQKCV